MENTFDNEQSIRPNIELPVDLWKETKKAAIDFDVSQSSFVEQAIQEKLARIKQAA